MYIIRNVSYITKTSSRIEEKYSFRILFAHNFLHKNPLETRPVRIESSQKGFWLVPIWPQTEPCEQSYEELKFGHIIGGFSIRYYTLGSLSDRPTVSLSDWRVSLSDWRSLSDTVGCLAIIQTPKDFFGMLTSSAHNFLDNGPFTLKLAPIERSRWELSIGTIFILSGSI